MRRDWLQVSSRLDCKPRGSQELNAISRPSGDWEEISFGIRRTKRKSQRLRIL
jgi:hypothetical protein